MDTHSSNKPRFFERLSAILLREPEDREQLIDLLHSAHERELLDADALSITEGALAASEISVREVMVPRAKMQVIDVKASLTQVLTQFNATAHSRFPVVDGSRDKILGILLAKDLLRLQDKASFSLRDLLRPAVFIPESKRLNVLLREFRVSHNHMALVIDEYAGVSGLITIEDVLEQIVGDIEDEHDVEEDSYIKPLPSGDFLIKALTPIENFNEFFDSEFSDDEFDTVGGLVMSAFGHLPKRNEVTEIGPYRFRILNADSRRIHLIRLTPIAR